MRRVAVSSIAWLGQFSVFTVLSVWKTHGLGGRGFSWPTWKRALTPRPARDCSAPPKSPATAGRPQQPRPTRSGTPRVAGRALARRDMRVDAVTDNPQPRQKSQPASHLTKG